MRKPLLLDLFCGAGGAAMGYHRAGFEVVGVDINPMPRYPFIFREYDALEYLQRFVLDANPQWRGFDAIHASPPCQGYSLMSRCRPGLAEKYPKLIEPTRALMRQTGLPYVIENTPPAPLMNPVTLCGSQFGLTVHWPPHGQLMLRRHRLFEANFPLLDAGPHDHSLRSMPVYGHGEAPRSKFGRLMGGTGGARAARDVMRINWMNREEICESIPPAYTEHVGRSLMAAVRARQGYESASERIAA